MLIADLENSVGGSIVIAERGDCTFIEKARKAQEAGAVAVIIVDNVPETSAENEPMFAMSGDGKDDVVIPVVFLFSLDGAVLTKAIATRPELEVSGERARGGWMELVCKCNRSLSLQIHIMQMVAFNKLKQQRDEL